MLSFFYVESFLKAYLYTFLTEFAVCYLINRRFGFRVVVVVLIVNAFSLPFVWFVFPALTVGYRLYLLIAETFAVVSEALLMRMMFPISVKRALATSIAMNMASYTFGVLFPWLIF